MSAIFPWSLGSIRSHNQSKWAICAIVSVTNLPFTKRYFIWHHLSSVGNDFNSCVKDRNGPFNQYKMSCSLSLFWITIIKADTQPDQAFIISQLPEKELECGRGDDFLNEAKKSPRPKVWGNNMHHFYSLFSLQTTLHFILTVPRGSTAHTCNLNQWRNACKHTPAQH